MKQNQLLANLLILLIVAMGFVRAFEWIIRSSDKLEQLSDIYIAMSHVVDINSAGWLLMVSCIVLGLSMFSRGIIANYFMLVGGTMTGIILTIYAMIASENALLLATSYSIGTVGLMAFTVAIIGGVAIWKTRTKKE